MNGFLWSAILGMFVATYSVRASFIVFGKKLRFPPAVIQALGHVPVAVLTAIVVPEALQPGGQLDVSATNPYLIGTLVAGLVAWRTRNVLIAVLISFAVFGLMRWLL